MPKIGLQAKSWAVTYFGEGDMEFLIIQLWDPSIMVYLGIGGPENCPTTGRSHFHILVVFSKRVMRSLVSKRFAHRDASGAWCEVARCDNAFLKYCKKGGNPFKERGVLPKSGSAKGGAVVADKWKSAYDLAKSNKVADVSPQMQIQSLPNLNRIAARSSPTPPNLTACNAFWFYGPAGVGKSTTARALAHDLYSKDAASKWFDGLTSPSQGLLIDDLDPYCGRGMGRQLKIWGDMWPFQAEMKGAVMNIRPWIVIVTSQYLPDQVWPDDAKTVEAIQRRFEVVTFNNLLMASSLLVGLRTKVSSLSPAMLSNPISDTSGFDDALASLADDVSDGSQAIEDNTVHKPVDDASSVATIECDIMSEASSVHSYLNKRKKKSGVTVSPVEEHAWFEREI